MTLYKMIFAAREGLSGGGALLNFSPTPVAVFSFPEGEGRNCLQGQSS